MGHIDRSALDEKDLRQAFLLNPNNRLLLTEEQPPHRVSRHALLTVGLVLLWAVGSLSLLNFAVRSSYQYVLLTLSPQETRGTVLDRRIRDTEDSRTYLLMVRYTVEDITYEREIAVEADVYERAGRGEPLPLIYATAEPGVAMAAPPHIGTVLFIWIIVLVWMAPVLADLPRRFRHWRQSRRKLRSGQLIKAEKIRTWSSLNSSALYTVHIDYRFLSPHSSQRLEGSASHVREDLRVSAAARPLHTAEVLPGQPILLVLYQNDQRYELL
jgi:hypothetical protein